MSARPVRKPTDQLQLLERILNKTTLTTQRVGHDNIVDLGGDLLDRVLKKAERDKEDAIRRAVQAAEEKAARELKEALDKARQEAERDKKQALEEQRLKYERLAAQVAEQRDRLEAERIELLTRRFLKEKEEALRKQWEECERIKEKAIKDALEKQEKELKRLFAIEKEKAIAEALAIARKQFQKRLEKEIRKTIAECERIAAEEAARVAKLHQQECDRLNDIIFDLKRQVRDEIAARQMVQEDFRAIQRDYRRFINYHDGRYHSDYMMKLKKHGMRFDVNWDRKDSTQEDADMVPLVLHTYLGKEGKLPPCSELDLELPSLKKPHHLHFQ
ncbi:uncharacterized protein [Ptychodera flava]|uniref:uncharacterized protein n=1 Tax=Ptychodera flava TaxID=63121 RepID=UPI00396A22D6